MGLNTETKIINWNKI